jgi:phosphoserine phosphatase RsbU/P
MSEALEADPGAPRRPEGERRGTGRPDWTPAFANPQGSERLAEYLDTFHRLTGIRSRLVIEADSGELTVHDSLGDPGRAEFTEMTWLVMPSVRIRLATSADSGEEDRKWLAVLRESASRLVASEVEGRFFASELGDRYAEIDLLTSVGETLGSVVHLERAAGRLLDRLSHVVAADCAAIWVPAEAEPLRRLAAGGPDAPNLMTEPAPDVREWVDRALRSQLPQVRPRRAHARAEDERTFLAVPLRHAALHGNTLPVGVLAARGREGRDTFSQADVNLAATVAAHLAAAIENDRLTRESLVQERMLVELELAHHLQMKLLPDLEDFAGMADVAARCEPADSVGGDFYHLFRLPGNRLGVMLGDVSSHGYSAGLIMALTMSAASITVRDREDPADVLQGIHHELVRKLESTEMYMTLCYAVVDPVGGRIRYANAGHPHAYRVNTREVKRLDALNPPLGIAEFDAYSQREVEWVKGRDMLLMFTDGISECLESDRLWSDEGLTSMAMESSGAAAQQVLDRVFELAAAPGGVAADDRTALVVK